MARGKRDDLSGQVFGNLTVLPNSMRNKQGDRMWLCLCTCGGRVWKAAKNLKAGKIKSCSYEHRWERSLEETA